MSNVRLSSFKQPEIQLAYLQAWNQRVQAHNQHYYQKHLIETRFGQTHVWGHRATQIAKETLVFLPGARTCGLFWDLDHVLAPLKADYDIWIPDVNGQPGLSAGVCPDIATTDYGDWLKEVFEALNISKATVIGASQGALIGIKFFIQAPQRVKQLVLMNPGGIQAFSTKFYNLYHNMLPIFFPSDRTIAGFFNKVILHPPHHQVSETAFELMMGYMRLALRDFKFAGDYPRPLRQDEFEAVTCPVHWVLGDKDPLFPTPGTIKIAKAHFPNIQGIHVLPNVGHGIETSPAAIAVLQQILASA